MNFLKEILYRLRGDFTTEKLISMGMKVGKNFGRLNGVILDPSHCWLIEIGDNVTMAPRVHILCHDASTKTFLNYTKIGRVTIGDNVFIGAESVVLPGVTIGNNVIIGANSTVTHDVPDNMVYAGSPARPICTLEEYLEKEKRRMKDSPCYDDTYTLRRDVSMELRMKQKEELQGKMGVYRLMNEAKISIIVPAYNIENYIEKTVQSICEQTYRNIEILLVNDGSTDRTPQLLEKIAAKDCRIKVIHKENGGVTSARLRGVKESTGEWIGFVDGDDYIEPQMYEMLISNAVSYGADISHCGYRMVFPSRVDMYYGTRRLVEQDNKAGMKDLLEGSFVEPGLCNKLYNKKLFYNILHNEKMDLSIKNNEDLLMNFYLFRSAEKSVFLDECPYYYMVRKGSAATSRLNENKLRDPLKVLRILENETSHDPKLQIIVRRRIVGQLIGLSTMSLGKQAGLIRPYRLAARKNLRKMLPEILTQNYSIKQKMMAVWVAVWPASYAWIHSVYAKITGLDKKYEVS